MESSGDSKGNYPHVSCQLPVKKLKAEMAKVCSFFKVYSTSSKTRRVLIDFCRNSNRLMTRKCEKVVSLGSESRSQSRNRDSHNLGGINSSVI